VSPHQIGRRRRKEERIGRGEKIKNKDKNRHSPPQAGAGNFEE
jgi:hypothetical protein